MKKHSLVKKLFFVGSILTACFACQPKVADAPQNESTDQTPAKADDDDDDDGDDGAYGDGDTSAMQVIDAQEPVYQVLSASDVSDIREAVELHGEISFESSLEAPIALEAMAPIELTVESEVVESTPSEE